MWQLQWGKDRLTLLIPELFIRGTMVFRSTRGWKSTAVLFALTLFPVSFSVQPVQTEAQSTGSQTQNPPANQQSSQDIPDAPSTVQPPPKPLFPPEGPARARGRVKIRAKARTQIATQVPPRASPRRAIKLKAPRRQARPKSRVTSS